jgi:ubiquitin-protein ligase
MYQSPRVRRLRNDLTALERLRSESSVFRFVASGDPPQHYHISFQGRGLRRDRGKVKALETHYVEIKLGASYPRTMPEIRWVTPVYHPNISEIGMVCLGGYGTHWVPSVQLDELCTMLWDMVRYHNYDIRSPYNRDAALWVASQTTFLFPTDSRPIRDLRAALGRIASSSAGTAPKPEPARRAGVNGAAGSSSEPGAADTPIARVRRFVESYSWVFVNGSAASERPAEAPRAVPTNSELLALAAAVLGSTPERRDEPSQHEDEFDKLVADACAWQRRNEPSQHEDDEVILPSGAAAVPQREPPPQGGDEIIFIDE